MQFLIIAEDKPGEGTLERRLASRNEHMAGIKRLKAEGRILDGGALLDDEGRMVGSVVLCDFESRDALNTYLREEVYSRQDVWGELQIRPFRRVDWDRLATG